jgi:hypothetical protein
LVSVNPIELVSGCPSSGYDAELDLVFTGRAERPVRARRAHARRVVAAFCSVGVTAEAVPAS